MILNVSCAVYVWIRAVKKPLNIILADNCCHNTEAAVSSFNWGGMADLNENGWYSKKNL
jgi:hypothetical protein